MSPISKRGRSRAAHLSCAVTGVNSGQIGINARAVAFEKAQSASFMLRVANPVEIDSIRPNLVRFGDTVTVYGVGVDSIFFVQLGPATLFDYPFEDRAQLTYWSDVAIANVNSPESPVRSEQERFAELARQHSACPSKEQGGALGQISKGQTVPEFERQLFRLPAGLCPQPLESRYGFHLVTVTPPPEGAPATERAKVEVRWIQIPR